MELQFELLRFDQLTTQQLYAVLMLRQSVFVVEQNCPYLDCDGKDIASYHLLATTANGELVAYLRIIPAGISYPEVSIGRVVTHTAYRKFGFGKRLMKIALEEVEKLFGAVPIRIGAQSYLLQFYELFGFEKLEAYIEDDIPHHIMLRK